MQKYASVRRIFLGSFLTLACLGALLADGAKPPAPAAPAAQPAPKAGALPATDPSFVGPPAIEAPAEKRAAPAAQTASYSQPGKAPIAVPGAAGVPAPSAGPTTPGAAPSGARAHFAPVLPGKDYAPPVMYVDQPKYDFGDVFKGEVVAHRFEVENKGGSPLIISKVRPSCGCTLVNEAQMDKVISPGGKGSFELKIETSRLPVGRQSKYADVSSNDPKQAQFRVFVQGKIDSLLKVEPEQPKIQTVKGKGQGATDITLTKNSTTDIKVLGAKSQSGRLLVEMKEVQPANLWKLDVKTNYGPKDTQSYFSESVQVEVQIGERKMNQDITITVQVKDRIEMDPRSLYYKKSDFQPLKDKGTPAEKVVSIKANLEEPYAFKVTNTKLEDPDNFFKVRLEPVKEGREYKLVVSVDKLPEQVADPKVSKSMKGNVILTTDDPLMPEINMRLIAFY